MESEINIILSPRDCHGKLHEKYKTGSIVIFDIDDDSTKYDAYMTWSKYFETCFWNNEIVGKGEDGIDAMIDFVKKMPAKSRILAFPGYHDDRSGHLSNLIKKMRPILEQGEHVLLLSPRNERGEICEIYGELKGRLRK
jgi:hypothetical protein